MRHLFRWKRVSKKELLKKIKVLEEQLTICYAREESMDKRELFIVDAYKALDIIALSDDAPAFQLSQLANNVILKHKIRLIYKGDPNGSNSPHNPSK